MAVRHIIPQAHNEGMIGTPGRLWNRVYTWKLTFGDSTELTTKVLGGGAYFDAVEETAEYTLNSATPINHSLGAAPTFIQWHIRCFSADGNWNINDYLFPGWLYQDDSGNCDPNETSGIGVWVDASNNPNSRIYWRLESGASFHVSNPSSPNNYDSLDTSKWKIRFYLFRDDTINN